MKVSSVVQKFSFLKEHWYWKVIVLLTLKTACKEYFKMHVFKDYLKTLKAEH